MPSVAPVTTAHECWWGQYLFLRSGIGITCLINCTMSTIMNLVMGYANNAIAIVRQDNH